MNFVYLIGNGFDINLGMETSYDKFYEFYEQQKCTSSVVEKFKSEISDDLQKWADLEVSLGSYTKEVKDPEFR